MSLTTIMLILLRDLVKAGNVDMRWWQINADYHREIPARGPG
ncbi:hypothetical protein [Fodinibius halophilus]|nr:hypothetical protein [Fodinibius halophilus]